MVLSWFCTLGNIAPSRNATVLCFADDSSGYEVGFHRVEAVLATVVSVNGVRLVAHV